MEVSICTPFPNLYTSFLETSLVGRAQERNLVNIQRYDLFDFVAPKERIDAPTFGHGAGMLIRPTVVQKAVDSIEKQSGKAYKIFFSPAGKKLDQRRLQKIYRAIQERGNHVALFPARYEGMDARVQEHYADEVISIGDYVLMGGDIPAMVFLEGLLRFVPGVVGKQDSVEQDSFMGPFVDYPEYTEPVEWQGIKVPDVVRSGNHKALADWREDQAVRDSVIHHFDWVRSYPLDEKQRDKACRFIPKHYAVLMHDQIALPEQESGKTSVTSLDIHDIARSAKTYGLDGYFIVTSLIDQQRIVQTLLDFWKKGEGAQYNVNRHEALKNVSCVSSLQDVCAAIKKREGVEPLIVTTSAQSVSEEKQITYHDQERVWEKNRPVLFVFGTGKGLAQEVFEQSDFVLCPIEGFSSFNHLSVRSAAAVIFDRWLGINKQV